MQEYVGKPFRQSVNGVWNHRKPYLQDPDAKVSSEKAEGGGGVSNISQERGSALAGARISLGNLST